MPNATECHFLWIGFIAYVISASLSTGLVQVCCVWLGPFPAIIYMTGDTDLQWLHLFRLEQKSHNQQWATLGAYAGSHRQSNVAPFIGVTRVILCERSATMVNYTSNWRLWLYMSFLRRIGTFCNGVKLWYLPPNHSLDRFDSIHRTTAWNNTEVLNKKPLPMKPSFISTMPAHALIAVNRMRPVQKLNRTR